MIVWLDAQLPPGLAEWLTVNAGVNAYPVRNLGLRNAPDKAIFDLACKPDHVIISKDIDFVHLVQRHGPPPQIVHLQCGNLTKASLIALFEGKWHAIKVDLESGAAVVKVDDAETH